jgi:hypothetical protein
MTFWFKYVEKTRWDNSTPGSPNPYVATNRNVRHKMRGDKILGTKIQIYTGTGISEIGPIILTGNRTREI